MNLREAAQMALEALMKSQQHPLLPDDCEAAITALRAALAEPEQEPDGISWLKRDSGYFTAPTPRKPLSEGEIYAAIQGIDSLRAVEVARAIERAHGIGEQHGS